MRFILAFIISAFALNISAQNNRPSPSTASKEIDQFLTDKITAENSYIEWEKDLEAEARTLATQRTSARFQLDDVDSFSTMKIKEKRKYAMIYTFAFSAKKEEDFTTKGMADHIFQMLITDNEIELANLDKAGLSVIVKRKKGKYETYAILVLKKEGE